VTSRLTTFLFLLAVGFLSISAHAQEGVGPVEVRIDLPASIPLRERAFGQIILKNNQSKMVTFEVQVIFGTNLNLIRTITPGNQSSTPNEIRASVAIPGGDFNLIWFEVEAAYVGDGTVQTRIGIDFQPPQSTLLDIIEVLPLKTTKTLYFRVPAFGAQMDMPAVAYNKATDRLFFLEIGNGGVSDLRMYDPEDGLSARRATGGIHPSMSIVASGDDEILYTGTGGSSWFWTFQQFRADPFGGSGTAPGARDPIFDLEVSPKDSSVLAVARPPLAHVQKGTNVYPLPEGDSGHLEISEDGGTLYVGTSDCVLELFLLQNGVIPMPLKTYTNISCADFEVANGTAYFDDGTILDTETGQLTTNLFALNPLLVATAPEEKLHVLTQTNNALVIRQIRAGTFENVNDVEIAPVRGRPLEMISMGSERVIVRTTEEIIVVTLPNPNAPTMQVARPSASSLTVSFSTLAGRTYRLEGSTDLRNWQLEETIPGTGEVLGRSIQIGQNHAFYRLVIEPN
jgi:hypothetical protein